MDSTLLAPEPDQAEEKFPFYPLNALDMPLPGPDFIDFAVHLGDEKPKITGQKAKDKILESYGPRLEQLHYDALYRRDFTMPIKVKNRIETAKFLSGSLWGCEVSGPRRAEVAVVGKWPGNEEMQRHRNFIGQSGEIAIRAVEAAGVTSEEYRNWYITNLIKHPNLDPASNSVPASWTKNALPLLEQELRLVRPKFVLALGAEAARALVDKSVKIDSAQGNIYTRKIPIHLPGRPEMYHEMQIMVCIHPARVIRQSDKLTEFQSVVKRFVRLTRGEKLDIDEIVDHRIIGSERALKELVDEIIEEGKQSDEKQIIAIDCEWHGEYPTNPGAWLRTIQISHKPGFAACIVLREQGGAPYFTPDLDRIAPHLRRLLIDTDERRVRIAGHFLRADLPWLLHFDPVLGEALIRQFHGAELPEDTRTEGGIDTGLAAHSVTEAPGEVGFKLETLALNICGVPRYDNGLHKWKVAYCKANNIEESDLEGYGECDDETLWAYANWDADATRRLVDAYNKPGGLLDKDQYGNSSRVPFWISQRATLGFLEMEMTGLLIDQERAEVLTELFRAAQSDLTAKLRETIKWPGFNPASHQQCRNLLFGPQYTGKIDKKSGEIVGVAPKDAVILGLKPIKSAGKPSRDWYQLETRGEADLYNPSTDKEVLGILASRIVNSHPEKSDIVKNLRYIRFAGQVLRNPLKPPAYLDKQSGEYARDEAGKLIYEKGLMSYIMADGRVRTHLYQTKETGRASSARPPLQNLCVDPMTEYLTRRGWVFAPDLREDDEVAQYYPNTGHISFVRPTQIHQSHFCGLMKHIVGEQIDLLVTPNHRCALRRRRSGEIFEVKALQFPAGSESQHLHAGEYKYGTKSLSWSQVAWLVAVQADGSYANGHNGQGIVFTFTKQRKKERLRTILTSLGANWSERITDFSDVSEAKSNTTFYIGVEENRQLVDFAKQTLGESRCFGPWLLDYNRETLDLFVDEVLHWDGLWTRQTEYSSSDFRNADWVQALWTLSGIRARQRCYRSNNPRAKEHYCVDIPKPSRRRDYTSVKNTISTDIPWDGPVYCVSVPSEFVVVRRGGKVSITGNSKRREKEYKDILGDRYCHSIRSIIKASPGYVLVEADYTGAELFMMAIQSGDERMIDHCLRANLPESDPNHYDIHGNIAKKAFNLPIETNVTKSIIKDMGYDNLRTGAKTIAFGIPYGRGDAAVIRAVEEEGVIMSQEEADAIRNTIFGSYPRLPEYMDRCRNRVKNPGWMANCMGRYRRFQFTGVDDGGEMERQANNFPIQSGVADAVSRALDYLYLHPRFDADGKLLFRMVLQIHDAILFEVRIDALEWFVGTDEKAGVIAECMTNRVPIWSCDLDGNRRSGPYYLGTEIDVAESWGEKIPLERGQELGVPAQFCIKPKVA